MPLIFLFTDFGGAGPYVGQVHAVLARAAPGCRVIDLMHDLPAFNPKAAAYVLPAYAAQAQAGDVVMAVVDPGVGTLRPGVAVEADGVWYVGPDNGLFSQIVRRAGRVRAFSLAVPPAASATFHGRDVFAPAAALLAQHQPIPASSPYDPARLDRPDWPEALTEVVYVDPYGNALTGLRVSDIKPGLQLQVGRQTLSQYRTFADVPSEQPFFYENANGLIEIAANGASAAGLLALKVGTRVRLQTP